MFCFRRQKDSSNQQMHLKSNTVTPSSFSHQSYPTQPSVNNTHPPSYSNVADYSTVPIQFYPNNIYESGDRDRLNIGLTDAFDGSKFYNTIRDDSIPYPPGFIVTHIGHYSTPISVHRYRESTASSDSPPVYCQISQPTAPPGNIEYPKLQESDQIYANQHMVMQKY